MKPITPQADELPEYSLIIGCDLRRRSGEKRRKFRMRKKLWWRQDAWFHKYKPMTWDEIYGMLKGSDLYRQYDSAPRYEFENGAWKKIS